MKKILLAFLIFLDVVIMASAGFFLYAHLNSRAGNSSMPTLASSGAVSLLGKPSLPAVSTAAPHFGSSILTSSGTAVATASEPPLEGGMRKILFSYRNPKAKQVSIRADFTGWKAEAMHKDARGMWIYQGNLLPGEYAYCFTVDDKTFRDPANKRVKQIGRTYVSAIDVKPAPPSTH